MCVLQPLKGVLAVTPASSP